MAVIRYRVPSLSIVGSPAVPAWYSALTHKQWATPLSNTIASVADPLSASTNAGTTGLSSVTEAWTGMGCDGTNYEIFMLRNGGHDDYYGNEVYSCNLNQSSPAWTRRRNATARSGSGNQTAWPDGRPTSDHTEASTVAGGGRWFSLGSNAMNANGGTNVARWWEFDRNANDWIDLGDHVPNAGVGFPCGQSLYDPVDNQIIQVRGWSPPGETIFQDLSNMSGSAAVINSNGWGGGGIGTLYFNAGLDYTNRVILLQSMGVFKILRINSSANKAAAWQTLSVSGSMPPQKAQNRGMSFFWHPPSAAFLTWSGEQTIYKLTPTVSGGTYTGATWSAVSSGFTGVTPIAFSSAPVNGMYSKINLLQMPDGNYAFIAFPNHNGPVYVCKLTGAV